MNTECKCHLELAYVDINIYVSLKIAALHCEQRNIPARMRHGQRMKKLCFPSVLIIAANTKRGFLLSVKLFFLFILTSNKNA